MMSRNRVLQALTLFHAPEMPTRFAKQLTQIIRGGVAVGMSRKRAMKLAIRCARDSSSQALLLRRIVA
jgi:hypothetical protein